MSKLSTDVKTVLDKIYPANPFKRVFEERYINYKGVKLFFDFFIKELSCFVECQGIQHTKYSKHFHGNAENFKSQKYRDNLKIAYVQENNMYLIRIYSNEKISPDMILSKIDKAFDSIYNFSD